MKTRSFIRILMVFMVSAFIVQCNQSDKSKDGSKNDREQDQGISKTERKKPELVYDDRGNIIERHIVSYRKKDNSIRGKNSYYYTYDDNNNVIHEVKKAYTPDGELKYKNVNEYKYDDKNQKIEQIFYSYDANDALQRKARNTFKYNDQGHKIEDIGYYSDGTIKSKIILDPDESGALQSEEYINYDPDGNKTSHKKYYYSAYGLEKTVDLMEDN